MNALTVERDTDEPLPVDQPSSAEPLSAEPLSAEAVVGELGTDSDWWEHALCNVGDGRLTQMFFSEELQDIAEAKRICARCPAMVSCLEGALTRREPWGVWGGQLFLNGRILSGKRRRGRPPKQPRLEDQLPHVPIPEQLQTMVEVRIPESA